MVASAKRPSNQFDAGKFLAAVHYVCARCDPRRLGRVKLHKILYYADMLRFVQSGSALTGDDYLKQQFGPTARHLGWALKRLQDDGKIRVSESDYFGFRKTDFESLLSPDASALSADEIELLDKVADGVCQQTAKEISELSHAAPWEMVKLGEEIPYYTAYFLAPAETTDEDVAWGEATVRELKLAL